MPMEAERLVEPVGGFPRGTGSEVQFDGSQLRGISQDVLQEFPAQLPAAAGAVHHHVFDITLGSGRGMINGKAVPIICPSSTAAKKCVAGSSAAASSMPGVTTVLAVS